MLQKTICRCDTDELLVIDLTPQELDELANERLVQEHITKLRDIDRELAGTDSGMARVVEDLINVLLAKGIMSMTDLPPSAQQKIQVRQRLRQERSATA